MKKLLAIAAVAGLLTACDQGNRGGTGTDTDVSRGAGTATNGSMTTNGTYSAPKSSPQGGMGSQTQTNAGSGSSTTPQSGDTGTR